MTGTLTGCHCQGCKMYSTCWQADLCPRFSIMCCGFAVLLVPRHLHIHDVALAAIFYVRISFVNDTPVFHLHYLPRGCRLDINTACVGLASEYGCGFQKKVIQFLVVCGFAFGLMLPPVSPCLVFPAACYVISNHHDLYFPYIYGGTN